MCKIQYDEGISGGGIAGLVIGSVVLIAAGIGLAFYCCRKDPLKEAALQAL
jgi:hypothetical protein